MRKFFYFQIVLMLFSFSIPFLSACKKKSEGAFEGGGDDLKRESASTELTVPSELKESFLASIEGDNHENSETLSDSELNEKIPSDVDETKEEKKSSNPPIQTMAQQIQLMKKGEWIVDLYTASVSKPEVVVDKEMSSGKSGLGDKKEIQLNDGSKIFQTLVGSPAFIRNDDQFNFRKKFNRVVPYDYRVGQLADLKVTAYRESRIITNLNEFFTLFANEKKIAEQYLYKESKELIINNLNYYVQAGAMPDALFRIGKINAKSNSVIRVNVRFYYNDSCTDGEVILEEVVDKKGEKNWLISDIQVDFMQLLEKYKGFSEPYLPSSFQYFDWE